MNHIVFKKVFMRLIKHFTYSLISCVSARLPVLVTKFKSGYYTSSQSIDIKSWSLNVLTNGHVMTVNDGSTQASHCIPLTFIIYALPNILHLPSMYFRQHCFSACIVVSITCVVLLSRPRLHKGNRNCGRIISLTKSAFKVAESILNY